MSQKTILIGIAGGTASGKTSVAKAITQSFTRQDVALIEQDSYYHDHIELPLEERALLNYDHPEAFDFGLIHNHITALLKGEQVMVPMYNYEQHCRAEETVSQQGQKIIVLEGMLALFNEELRDMMDIKVYVDTSDDIRIIRRIKRDVNERDRTIDSVIEQYLHTVRPMHLQFTEPTKAYADIIIPQGASNVVGIDILTTKIKALLT